MKQKIFIWLDDERTCPYKDKFLSQFDKKIDVSNPDTCIMILSFYENIDIYIDFDHDLGNEKTGYDIAKFMVENQIPAKYHIHSQNVVGRQNIDQLLSHYGYEKFQENEKL